MMKKTGRFLALLMILALLLAEIPAMADEAIARTDPNEIDTVFEEITSPDEFKLGKYLYVNDTSLQKVEFTAPKTGTYYLYQRRIDNVSPMITVYTSANDPVPAYRMEGTAGQPLVMDVYLKKDYTYIVNFNYALVAGSTETEGKGIFIASCKPGTAAGDHMEPDGSWTVITKPENGKRGVEGKYCDFCHQMGLTRYIPAIPYNLSVANIKTDSIKLRWKASQDATKYVIYRRKKSASATPKRIATIKVTSSTKTSYSYVVTGLKMNTKYFFQVKAVTSYGDSALSEAVSATPTLKAPNSFKLTSPAAKKVKISWKARSGADGYIIYRARTREGKYYKYAYVTGGKKTSTLVRGSSGITYYFKIAAYKKVDGKKMIGALTETKSIKVQ